MKINVRRRETYIFTPEKHRFFIYAYNHFLIEFYRNDARSYIWNLSEKFIRKN